MTLTRFSIFLAALCLVDSVILPAPDTAAKEQIKLQAGPKHNCTITNSFVTRLAPTACLWCICYDDGSYNNCDVKICKIDELATPEPKCKPGRVTSDACNICFCDTKGLNICTKRSCPNYYPKKQDIKCTPNSKFNLKCNECICNHSGNFARCTDRRPWECGNNYPYHLNEDFDEELL